jgi:hypothetical protein
VDTKWKRLDVAQGALLSGVGHPWRDTELRLIQELMGGEGFRPITREVSRLQRGDDRCRHSRAPCTMSRAAWMQLDDPPPAAEAHEQDSSHSSTQTDCVHVTSPRHF